MEYEKVVTDLINKVNSEPEWLSKFNAAITNRVPVPKHTPHKSTHKIFGKITPHFNKAPWEEQINQL
jgi:predicted methyltransferase